MENRIRMELHQVDIKGGINERFVEQIVYPGYEAREAGRLVVVKTLYGLKQSGRQWYQKLSFTLTSLGFTQCSIDQVVFFKSSEWMHELAASRRWQCMLITAPLLPSHYTLSKSSRLVCERM
jgi:hypothetical protein